MEESPASSISGSDSDTPETVGAISVELGRSSREQKQALDRYRETEKWIWSECSTGGSLPKATRAGQRREARVLLVCDLCHDLYTNKDKHCQCCHATFDKATSPRQFSEHIKDCEEKKRKGDLNWKLQGPIVSMPSRLQLLKVEIVKIEVRLRSLFYSSVIFQILVPEDFNRTPILGAGINLSSRELFDHFHQFC